MSVWLPGYGHMLAIRIRSGRASYAMAGWGLQAARGLPTMEILRQFVRPNETTALGDGVCLFQYGDYAELAVRSLAYCRRVTSDQTIALVPDAYFFQSDGYACIRTAVLQNTLPPWPERSAKVFWRGNPTFNYVSDEGANVNSFDQVPRITLCRRLKTNPHADVGLSGIWGQPRFKESMLDYLQSEQLLRGKVDMLAEASGFRFLLDIDGVASAWGLYEKFLLGACVIKIDSPYEQWFYDRLRPWQHFVPAAADFSDLDEKIDWCLSHDDVAREIARQGQALALEHSLQSGRRLTIQAIADATIAETAGEAGAAPRQLDCLTTAPPAGRA